MHNNGFITILRLKCIGLNIVFPFQKGTRVSPAVIMETWHMSGPGSIPRTSVLRAGSLPGPQNVLRVVIIPWRSDSKKVIVKERK